MGRKKIARSTTATVMVDDSSVTPTLEGNQGFSELHASLAKIGKIPGVKGYILKNLTSAVIDLKNPAKLVEYALLTSEVADACHESSILFDLNITRAVVTGRKLKMLCMIIGENKLGIFMEKTVDHTDISNRIFP